MDRGRLKTKYIEEESIVDQEVGGSSVASVWESPKAWKPKLGRDGGRTRSRHRDLAKTVAKLRGIGQKNG